MSRLPGAGRVIVQEVPVKRKPEIVFLEGFEEPKVGDPHPGPNCGYAHFHAWAEVQIKGGLKQTYCPAAASGSSPKNLTPTTDLLSIWRNHALVPHLRSRQHQNPNRTSM